MSYLLWSTQNFDLRHTRDESHTKLATPIAAWFVFVCLPILLLKAPFQFFAGILRSNYFRSFRYSKFTNTATLSYIHFIVWNVCNRVFFSFSMVSIWRVTDYWLHTHTHTDTDTNKNRIHGMSWTTFKNSICCNYSSPNFFFASSYWSVAFGLGMEIHVFSHTCDLEFKFILVVFSSRLDYVKRSGMKKSHVSLYGAHNKIERQVATEWREKSRLVLDFINMNKNLHSKHTHRHTNTEKIPGKIRLYLFEKWMSFGMLPTLYVYCLCRECPKNENNRK